VANVAVIFAVRTQDRNRSTWTARAGELGTEF
jgi:hypothetical protein